MFSHSVLLIIILVFTSLTLISLISGVVLMAIGNEFYIKHRNKIMMARVLLQFISLVLIALFFR
ncbi:hypothetical protein EDL79_03495 [Ehrlichia ruminantium]|uniref:HIG1 domain-containing protein n=1 Tax=Ehrlichia ruminantium TaxID=779 RepID=A0AAE6QBA2_EHRRU|nr:hypothetical protein EDL81_03480 [Ehrlichia ruminantium]QGR03608.1 hypothetical protein EDL80_03485 [Ehrlichia ruminantium]QGR04535.1 hypothetical protein EDL79_03495 [Ehrlichia ruminantium]